MDYQDELLRKLRDLPVPPPSPGFTGRVRAAARAAQPAPVLRPAYALAAGLILAVGVGIGVRLGQSDIGATPQVALVARDAVEPVRLLFSSPRELRGVTLQVQLPAGLELAGRPGRRELRWQVDLQAGANALELPVILRGDGGVLTASLSHGQDRRQFAVLVKVRPPAAHLSVPSSKEV